MKLVPAVAVFLAGSIAFAQSPPAQTSAMIGGKTLTIHYSAPSVRGRKIFGPGGLLASDPTYPAWRAGANSATSFHTDADLDIGGLNVPKGDYTLYAWIADPDNWQLILSKETGQWGLTYNAKMDLGRVKMTMSKPPAPIEKYKMTLSGTGPKTGSLRLEWENHIASVPITVK
ncbi:MAG TPA: DUF2911 domain-containing protein [Bryobacteraceae bacterium]|jgi:hypothetical protein|nr:DUF2911 domain-containing protein [Bryobacteraceae bacterium]